MNTKIYFENLPDTVTEKELTELFSAYGNVVEIHIAFDRTHNKSRSYGFVTMITPEGARSAIQSLNGRTFGVGTLSLTEAPQYQELAGSTNGRSGPRRKISHLY